MNQNISSIATITHTRANTRRLDRWIRTEFKQLNTELEQQYSGLDSPDQVSTTGLGLKQQLATQGGDLISSLLREGNTDEGFDSGFDLLGNVGFFMAACRRHEIDSEKTPQFDSHLLDASALSMQLGASLGVVPRFSSAHLETHNTAINGEYKSFTSLKDEQLFLQYNTRGVFAFIRASEALLHTLPLGISHPVTFDLLSVAKSALEDVVSNNQALFDKLDTGRFFYNVRPYYKPHKVGRHEYRGANAGDFAGINAIDLLLGLCRADDAYYSQLLVDKFLFMRPQDQLILRDCMRRSSLMDNFLDSLAADHKDQSWYQKNLAVFIEVCEAHGQTALQHHNMLIKKFIEKPAKQAELTDRADLTASGPPLPVLLRSLKKLCDFRCAANVDGLNTRFHDLEKLRHSVRPK